MHPRFTLQFVFALCVLISFAACGDDPPPEPEDRCKESGVAAFGSGKVSLTPNASKPVEVSRGSGSGFILGPAVYVALPGSDVSGAKKNLILKLFTSDEPTGLLDRISRATTDGAATFDIVDASEAISGSQNISGLNNYDCKFSENKLCAQVAVDTDGDGLVSDADELVFNARSGAITFIEAKGLSSSFKMTWSLSLAGNILNGEDNGAGNSFKGCLFSSYRSSGADRWDFY